MKTVFSLLFLFFLLTACSVSGTVPETQASPAPSAVPSPTPEDIYEVQVWVDNPNPARDETVTISGSLIKNGVYLSQMLRMEAWWPEEGQDRGVPNCFSMVIYQRGICTLEAKDYPSGVYVPVTVELEYNGKTYTGTTGFTPK